MKIHLHQLSGHLYDSLIRPRGSSVDGRRREFVLNTLLTGLMAIALIAVAVSLVDTYITHITAADDPIWDTVVFCIITAVLLLTSRRGKPQLAAWLLTGFLLASAVQFALYWSFRLAQVELLFALTIVIVGVLFRATLALVASLVVALCMVLVAYLQVKGLQHPYIGWDDDSFEMADAIGFIVTFVIMGLVSWLANHETDQSLQRARRSEAALQKERDSLELKVIERTHELEGMQAARLLEMQPFAEFGRIGASLVHDISNPLTAATLHLQELSNQENSDIVQQVQRNLQRLERYLLAARKQIKRESDRRMFSVGPELRQIGHLLTHRARRANVELVVAKVTGLKLYGDVVKFDQLVANLIANAIDACTKRTDGVPGKVMLDVTKRQQFIDITVTDNGVGITATQIEHLFEPFYSTKGTDRRGFGLGLAMVKQYVEHDFNGSIAVTSTTRAGTTFLIRLREPER